MRFSFHVGFNRTFCSVSASFERNCIDHDFTVYFNWPYWWRYGGPITIKTSKWNMLSDDEDSTV